MNANTLQIECTRIKAERDDLRALLIRALPYVEDCVGDPAYKDMPVAALARKMKEACRG